MRMLERIGMSLLGLVSAGAGFLTVQFAWYYWGSEEMKRATVIAWWKRRRLRRQLRGE